MSKRELIKHLISGSEQLYKEQKESGAYLCDKPMSYEEAKEIAENIVIYVDPAKGVDHSSVMDGGLSLK